MSEEPLPETAPEYVMINAMRRAMAEYGCVQRITIRVVRDEGFDGEWMEMTSSRKEPEAP
jgi:hypothetical protein